MANYPYNRPDHMTQGQICREVKSIERRPSPTVAQKHRVQQLKQQYVSNKATGRYLK